MAKGLCIILVVLGHTMQNDYKTYIYWFHMPAFFIFSGYLFKPVTNWFQFRSFMYKRTIQLIVPYICCLAVITLIRYEANNDVSQSADWIMEDLLNMLLGGRFLRDYYTVFWFITCLYSTQLLFAAILLTIKENKYRLMVISFAYIVAHIESWISTSYISANKIMIPWNIDVSLLALTYYAIGFWVKQRRSKISVSLRVVSLVSIITLILLHQMGLLNYRLDMKVLVYNHIILDLFVPVVMTIGLCSISKILSHLKLARAFILIGTMSLPIMYFHMTVNKVLGEIYSYGDLIFLLQGVCIPVIISALILKKFSLTRLLFLGISRPANRTVNHFKHLSA